MSYKTEIDSLTGETLAIQAILANVLREISKADPQLYDAIKLGFDNAASKVEDIAIRLGKAASSDQTVKARHVRRLHCGARADRSITGTQTRADRSASGLIGLLM
jgi:hypothetical protein